MKQLKDIPEGNKGKGLSKLPTAVRNKMGFKKQGGVIKAQSGTGKDPILSKEERGKEGMKPKKSNDIKVLSSKKPGKKQYRGVTRKPLADFKSKMKRRKGGGMVYQLYGGSTKDFSDGNKFIQSFYDKGGK